MQLNDLNKSALRNYIVFVGFAMIFELVAHAAKRQEKQRDYVQDNCDGLGDVI